MITTSQRAILGHALGIGGRSPGYRNHYMTSEDSSAEWSDLMALCDAGLMRRTGQIGWCAGETLFEVTASGKLTVDLQGAIEREKRWAGLVWFCPQHGVDVTSISDLGRCVICGSSTTISPDARDSLRAYLEGR